MYKLVYTVEYKDFSVGIFFAKFLLTDNMEVLTC